MAAGSAGSPLSVETEHLLTVRSPTEAYITSSVGMYGAEVVVATASEDMQLHLHRPFCKTHKVCCTSRWPDSGLWLVRHTPSCMLPSAKLFVYCNTVDVMA